VGYEESPVDSTFRRVSSAVEQRFCKPLVGSSILSPGTNEIKYLCDFFAGRSSQKSRLGSPWEEASKMASDDEFEERRRLTFEQAEGAEPLPIQLKLKELSQEFRAIAWAFVHQSIGEDTHSGTFENYIDGPWKQILRDRHVFRLHQPLDEFNYSANAITAAIKTLVMTADYTKVLGFLQFVIRHPSCPYKFAEGINGLLVRAHAAYRVVEKTIVPIGSEAESATIKRAMADVAASEFHGARAHLHKAAEALTAETILAASAKASIPSNPSCGCSSRAVIFQKL
jgi:hypothetical protein